MLPAVRFGTLDRLRWRPPRNLLPRLLSSSLPEPPPRGPRWRRCWSSRRWRRCCATSGRATFASSPSAWAGCTAAPAPTTWSSPQAAPTGTSATSRRRSSTRKHNHPCT
uniref:Uncharacterized protein n=1 Tax=Setaria italica TaxID=4555 RepID=K3ZGD2_SETIT